MPLGAGQLAESVRVVPTYRGTPGPPSLFVKLPSRDERSAATAARIGAYARECVFYQELLPRLDVRTPAYLGAIELPGSDPVLVLEDLSDSCQPLDQLRDGTAEEVTSAIGQLARLQAPFWNDERAVGGAARFYNRTADHIDGLAERYDRSWTRHKDLVGDLLDSRQREVVERFGAVCVDWAAGIIGPRTLVHQDLRLDNLLWSGTGAWLVDWQTLAWTTPAWDPSFLIGSALPPEVRRSTERRLVEAHVAALAERGVTGWSVDTAWQEHRRLSGSVLLAMVPAMAYVRPTSRGFDMFASLLSRGAQHAIDHDVLSFV
ncbi:phosphotransferase [Amycolatopsis acidiphila]|uniref:Phosphotransferase n=2 Tax=Amycolatopsis acidiphila TaxID=715473 RepID=A0A558A142_9PSEU|nr:phosphotransferase [Amycolatopsis acidiphila]